jgi:hypothetical protein
MGIALNPSLHFQIVAIYKFQPCHPKKLDCFAWGDFPRYHIESGSRCHFAHQLYVFATDAYLSAPFCLGERGQGWNCQITEFRSRWYVHFHLNFRPNSVDLWLTIGFVSIVSQELRYGVPENGSHESAPTVASLLRAPQHKPTVRLYNAGACQNILWITKSRHHPTLSRCLKRVGPG